MAQWQSGPRRSHIAAEAGERGGATGTEEGGEEWQGREEEEQRGGREGGRGGATGRECGEERWG